MKSGGSCTPPPHTPSSDATENRYGYSACFCLIYFHENEYLFSLFYTSNIFLIQLISEPKRDASLQSTRILVETADSIPKMVEKFSI